MKTAMILAAGRGERLKPLTDTIPKALCKLNNKPLVLYHVENLANCGFERLVINHAWLGGKIRQYLGNGSAFGLDIIYSPEPPGGLETGGGIVQALPLLGEAPFVTVNADIYTDYAFDQLKLPKDRLAHLVLVKNNPALNHQGDFGLSPEGLLRQDPREYTFAGICCYHPDFFQHCKTGRYSVTPLFRKYIAPEKLSGEIHQGCWFDIGSEQRLQDAESQIRHSIGD